MEVKARFSVASSGEVKAMGDATIVLGPEELVISPSSGGPMHISLRDVISVVEGEYRINVKLRSSEELTLFNLGYKYEDMVRAIFRDINELELQDLLMEEKLLKQGVRCDLAISRNGRREELGKAEVRLYQTAMVIMPDRSGIQRARFADVQSIEARDFRLMVHMGSGSIIEISKLGQELDPLRKGITDNAADLSAQVQRTIRDAHPAASLEGVQAASRLMKEGRPAGKAELEAACPGLWSALEKKLSGYSIGEEYAHLRGMARVDEVRIGIKRSLHKEEAQDYVFFLAPIYSLDKGKGGNAVAFEASSGEDEGRATYFFRIWSRKQYPLVDLTSMDREARVEVTSLATGLNAINFRREPIYLAEDRLYAPEYSRYRYAVMRVPELRALRERFIGRVMHSSLEQWKGDVVALLDFNVAQKDDSVRWKKSDEGQ